MAYALVANVGAGGASGSTTTGAIDTSGATLLVATNIGFGIGTVSDSKSNTWTGLTTRTALGSLSIKLWYCLNPTVGSGHTFATTGTFSGICVAAFSGAKASSVFDAESGNGATSGTTNSPGSITPAEDNELIVSGFGLNRAATASIGSGFTITDQIAYLAGNHYGAALAYKIQTTLAAVNPQWSWSGSDYNAASLACFKAAAAATAPQSKVVSQALNYSVNW